MQNTDLQMIMFLPITYILKTDCLKDTCKQGHLPKPASELGARTLSSLEKLPWQFVGMQNAMCTFPLSGL